MLVCAQHIKISNCYSKQLQGLFELNLLLDLEYFSEKITTAHFLAATRCNSPSLDCCMAKCDECAPKFQQLYDKLMTVFDENDIESEIFKSCQSSNRTTLETYVKSEDEFANLVIEKLKKMHSHDFVSQQQAKFLKDLKENLGDCEVAVVADFAENYSFILQDAVQGYHWNNQQATIHLFVVYYKTQDYSL